MTDESQDRKKVIYNRQVENIAYLFVEFERRFAEFGNVHDVAKKKKGFGLIHFIEISM